MELTVDVATIPNAGLKCLKYGEFCPGKIM